MKGIVAGLILLSLVMGAMGQSMPGHLDSLPISSRAAINAQIERTTKSYDLVLLLVLDTNSIGAVDTVWLGTASLPYSCELGSLPDAIMPNVTNLFRSGLTTNHIGYTAILSVTLCISPADANCTAWTYNNNSYFTVQFDGHGNPLVPTNILFPKTDISNFQSWCLAYQMPVPGALIGVEQVDYVWTNVVSGGTSRQMTRNGSNCPGIADMLVLYVSIIDPVCATNCVDAKPIEVVLWYSVANGVYDAFDIPTGKKCQSTAVSLTPAVTNGSPSILVRGFPGRQVAMQTSPDLWTWKTVISITMDTNGTAWFNPTNLTRPLFMRGRTAP